MQTHLLCDRTSQSQQRFLAKLTVLFPAETESHGFMCITECALFVLFYDSQPPLFTATVHNHKSLLLFCHSSLPLRSTLPSLSVQSFFTQPKLSLAPLLPPNENTTWCELKIVFPCCLPPAEVPDQKNTSSNCLRWWRAYGNISVHTQYKPCHSSSLKFSDWPQWITVIVRTLD